MKKNLSYYTIDPEKHDNSKILELIETDNKFPLCHKCGAPLVCALTPLLVQQLKAEPGLRCPNDVRHISRTSNFSEGVRDMWDELEELF